MLQNEHSYTIKYFSARIERVACTGAVVRDVWAPPHS